jgi:hypothetical protein
VKLSGEIAHVGARDEDTYKPKSKDLRYVLPIHIQPMSSSHRGAEIIEYLLAMLLNSASQIISDSLA